MDMVLTLIDRPNPGAKREIESSGHDADVDRLTQSWCKEGESSGQLIDCLIQH